MDLDTLIREADPARSLIIPKAKQADARQICAGTRHSLGGALNVLWVGVAVTVALAVAVVALAVGGQRHSSTSAAPIPTAARPLTSILGVLRRPQTAADRAVESAISKLRAPEPALVRLATVTPWGEHVILAVRQAHPDDTLSVITTGVLAGGGEASSGGLTAGRIEAGRGWSLEGAGRNFAGGSTGVRLFIVVPDGVAKVAFVLPRQPVPSSVPGSPVYRHSLAVSAAVHNNVAFVQILNRECCDGNLVTRWYAADGQLIKVAGNPADTGRIVRTPKPTPPTPLSRAAGRNPSTPNPVRALPRSGARNSTFTVQWRLLLTDADYRITATGPTGASCRGATDLSTRFGGGPNDVRGQLYGDSIRGGLGTAALCPGTYHLSVTVLDLGSAGTLKHPAHPFGRTTFTVTR